MGLIYLKKKITTRPPPPPIASDPLDFFFIISLNPTIKQVII